ncbi:MAG: thioredoxin domain-containing protein [Nibricoccus sp.]
MPNQLANEKSPYLLQHANNPVEWYPWGEAAFAKARAEQKPIFLSVGYSTCHWCHVMAHESFENADIAALLNQYFVPVKVDREERPDVDRVYMAYVQAMTGQGGWPMSVWLTPELKPFYGGTYFPPHDFPNRHGFPTVLKALAQGWATEKQQMLAEAERVIGALQSHFRDGRETGSGELLPAATAAFDRVFQYFHEAFDRAEGGFGGAPKFPRASNIDLLLRLSAAEGLDSPKGREALQMVEHTLSKMAQGGIRDHIGGGFHRYSVDDEWFVPHFEKMLYDQAQVAVNYLDVFKATGREVFAWVARDTLEYVARDLRAPEGGFYSAEDADSSVAHGAHEHAEGAFYLWSMDEIRSALGSDADVLCTHFGVLPEGNVGSERDPQGEFRGKNLLRQTQPIVETAQRCRLGMDEANERLLRGLKKLREVRGQRPRPHRDDKIITAWNGLAITAFARAAQILGDDEFASLAVQAAEFVKRELWSPTSGTLYRSYREGRGAVGGFPEDYAFLVQGLIDLYETTFDTRWLRWALALQARMDALFWDSAGGGYFGSVEADPSIVLRLKEDYDGAEPSPSSVAAMNLLRLAPVSGKEAGFRVRAAATVNAFQERWTELPQALPQMLCALDSFLEPAGQIVLAGGPQALGFAELLGEIRRSRGRRAVFAATDDEGWRWLSSAAPWLASMTAMNGRATAYLCEHYTCRPPVEKPEDLRELLA